MMQAQGIAVGAALLLIAASPAEAQIAGCRCGAIRGMHAETQRHVTREATEAASQIVGALRQHSQQNSRYLDRQVEAAERIADGAALNQAKLLRSGQRAEAESGRFDPNPDFCLVLDTALQPELPPRPSVATAIQGAADWSRGAAEPVAVNGLRMAAYLAGEREEIRHAGGADDATTEWKRILDQPTLDIEDPELRRALPRLIANSIDPFPPRPLRAEELREPAGLSEAVRRRAAEARNQAAIAAVAFPLELASPTLAAKPYRTIAARARYRRDIPDIISELQALEIRIAAYHVPDAETLELRHGKTERGLLQDLIDLEALNTRIAYLRLLQESRNAIVQAAILGLLTDGTVANTEPQ
ncbi:MAG: hypothetical protein OXF74_07200 [Rhodobacteraceae bacterium]|nr:hypothetical protein [Paracoccaceae bacterium]